MERKRLGMWVLFGAAVGAAFGHVGVGMAIGLALATGTAKPVGD